MRRRTDVPFVIGLCMVCMLAFSSSLLFEGKSGIQLKRDLASEWARVSGTAVGVMRNLQGTPAAKNQKTTHVHSTQTSKDSVQTTAVTGSATEPQAGTATSKQWSQTDIKRLSDIATEFTSSMSEQDWTEAVNAIATEKPADAEGTLAELLVTHLKPSDVTWLEQHFTGSAAFGQDDVVLLQKTLQQIESELTPEELSLVKQGLATYLHSQVTGAK